ncbi:MAG: hypothetical protein AB7O62_05680 [Pirellulales bacterium]
MTTISGRPRGNPFSTRHTRPGALPYLFEQGASAESLLDQLQRQHWRGQIVGPHGAGKSTLLAALQGALASAGLDAPLVVLRDGGASQDELWRMLKQPSVAGSPAVNLVLLDGAEQLTWLARQWLFWRCRRQGRGLLVTSHRDLGLPTLMEIHPRVATAQRVVNQLLAGQSSPISPDDVSAAFQRQQGDMREMLFALYDQFERRKAKG